MDYLVKAVAKGVRAYAAVTTDIVNEGIERHKLSPLAAAALGRTMTGALLLSANLKNKEALTLKIAGDGPLGKITADATAEGYVRGFVDNPAVDLPLNAKGKLDVGGGVGSGLISLTRFTGLKEPVTGNAELVTGEIAEDITNYLFVSEQTPSSVGLGVLVDTDGAAKAAGGFFVQPLPDADDDVLSKLEENIKNLLPVSSLIEDDKDPEEILELLLKGIEGFSILTQTQIAFRCRCSTERIEEVLLGVGEKELENLVKDGHAEVVCHFCGQKYEFDKNHLEMLVRVAKKAKEIKSRSKD